MNDFLQKLKSFMKKFLAIVILLGVGILAFLYWGTYENGVMAGKVLVQLLRLVISQLSQVKKKFLKHLRKYH